MFGLIKTLIRIGVILAVVAGGAVLIAGPDRVAAAIQQARVEVHQAIDNNIDNPVALRRQLAKLEKEYPARIKQVRRDLAELNGQIGQLEDEKSIAEQVVLLAEQDVEGLQVQFDHARNAERAVQTSGGFRPVGQLSPSRYEARMTEARQMAIVYQAQAEDAARDLGFLYTQSARLEDLLGKLEMERTQFQAQLLQLERQVDAVARNERLIEMVERRQRTIEEVDRYEVVNLEQLQAQLHGIRTQQEAELEALSNGGSRSTYEERARMELRNQKRGDAFGGEHNGDPVKVQVIPSY